MRLFLALALSLSALSALATPSGLKWDRTSLEAQLKPGTDHYEVRYDFVNASNRNIRIRAVSASCDCTIPKSDRSLYPPGAAGYVSAVIDTKGFYGVRDSVISVETDENVDIITLSIKLTAPALFVAQPRLVLWKIGENVSEKRVKLSINSQSIKLSEVVASNASFAVQVDFRTDREYILRILPRSTEFPAKGEITVTTKRDTETVGPSYRLFVEIIK